MRDYDLNGNGEIDYNELLTATLSHKVYSEEARLKEMFERFDVNKDNNIDLEELKSALAILSMDDMTYDEDRI
jgi:Ca2+-binding EF-hand superfamily protein